MPPKQRGRGRGRGAARGYFQPEREQTAQGSRGRGAARGYFQPEREQTAQGSRGRGVARGNVRQGEIYRGESSRGRVRRDNVQEMREYRPEPLEEFPFLPQTPSLLPLRTSRDTYEWERMAGMGSLEEVKSGTSAQGARSKRVERMEEPRISAKQPTTTAQKGTSSKQLEIPSRLRYRAAEGLSMQQTAASHYSATLEQLGLEMKSMDISSYKFPPRTSYGTKGRRIGLLANYFEIEIPHGEVYHYDVEIKIIRKVKRDEATVAGDADSKKDIKKYKCLNTRHNRNVIEEMLKQVDLFSEIRPAYDGEKNLYTRNPLPIKEPKTFSVTMAGDDLRPSLYEATIKPVNKEGQTMPMISLEPLHQLVARRCSVISEEIIMGIMAVETILRHGPALKLVPVGRSFFYKPREDEIPPLSGGREIWMGYHQSVKISQWKPMINIDMSATTFYESRPVIDYMLDTLYPDETQEYKMRALGRIRYLADKQRIALSKELKTLRIEVTHLGYPRKYRVSGISQQGADNTFFLMETAGKNISVARYFLEEHSISLKYPNLPCLVVGSPKKPVYLPLEVCKVVEGQHCRKKLSDAQTADMIKHTAIPPMQRFNNIQRSLESTIKESRAFSKEFGISISTSLTKLEGRVLEAPQIVYDRGQKIMPNNGSWDMRGKKFFSGQDIDKWILISFSTARWCDKNTLESFADKLCTGGEKVGMTFQYPLLIESCGRTSEPCDVIKKIKRKEPNLQLVVVVLPGNKNKTMYSGIKSVAETELGLMTQCVKDSNVSERKCNPQLICNLCQKINAKMGGLNNALVLDEKPEILKKPVLIVGADCSHPAPGDEVRPSIAAVVGSLDGYPSKYKASVRIQEPTVKTSQSDKPVKQEIIIHLKEMMVEVLMAFRENTRGKKPEKIIFYRDGVSEGEFERVVNEEVNKVREACTEVNNDGEYEPPITFIVVGKRHHTRFVPGNRRDGVGKCGNVPPGTTVDTKVIHPVRTDFFMCSHFGIQGTSRPSHYTVLWDDNNLNADELQKLTYFLCHSYARCTRSISVPCPVRYAHLAAFRAKQYLKYQNEGASSSGSESSFEISEIELKDSELRAVNVQEEVENTMYFV